MDDHQRLLRIHTKVRICPRWEAIDGPECGEADPVGAAQLSLDLKAGGKDGRRLKALDEDGKLWISLMASTPDIDDQNEIVEVSAFASSFEKYNDNPILTAYHKLDQPVGLAPAEITKAGLLQRGFVSAARPDIQQLVLDGVLSYASIGFIPENMEWDDELEVLRHLDLEHIETALVPVPANRNTWVMVDDVRKWRAWDIARKARPEVPAERPDPTPAAAKGEPGDDAELERLVDSVAGSVARVGSSLAGVAAAIAGK